jgi:hypothetical protein
MAAPAGAGGDKAAGGGVGVAPAVSAAKRAFEAGLVAGARRAASPPLPSLPY